MNKKRLIPLAFMMVALILILVILSNTEQKIRANRETTIKVGFVMTGTADEEGWNGLHFQGIQSASKSVGMELLYRENIKEYSGQIQVALNELMNEGASLIFLSSYGYVEEAINLIKEHPEVTFYSESAPEVQANNLNTYFAKMYQARYLSGIIAGMTTKTNRIGYVAAMPNAEVNRGINAFTKGVRALNPDAEVVVMWTGVWSDEEREKDLAAKLVNEQGVDLLTCHQNLPYVVQKAEEMGVYSIGYHESGADVSELCLTTVQCDWKKLYEEVIKDYRGGKTTGGQVLWMGLDREAVRLSEYSSLVSEAAIEEVEHAKQQILAGKEVFSGEIYDNQGNLRCAEGEMISNQTLLENMDWYVEGVIIYED